MQNLFAKLNSKFSLFYFVFFGLDVIYLICDFIYSASTYNLTALSYFYYITQLLIVIAFFGFGAFLLLKKDTEKFKVFFTMYVIYYAIRNLLTLCSVFGYPIYDSYPAITVIEYIICMLLVLATSTFGTCFFLNKFYPNALFITICNFALLTALGLNAIDIIIEIIGTAQGYMGWSSIISTIEAVSFYCVLLLGLNNKEICD